MICKVSPAVTHAVIIVATKCCLLLEFYLLSPGPHMFIYITNLWENVMVAMNVNYIDRQTFCAPNSHPDTPPHQPDTLDSLVPSYPHCL